MEYRSKWLRPEGDFTFVDKTKNDIVIIKNQGGLSAEFYSYSKQFHIAADKLIIHLLTISKEKCDIGKLDTWFFAIAYLYRHCLELILKGLVFKYITDEIEQKSVIGIIRHDLSKCFAIILENTPVEQVEKISSDIDWIKAYLDDISIVDTQSDMFRYPFSNKMVIFFEGQTYISLVALKQNMNVAYSILENMLIMSCPPAIGYKAFRPKLIISGGNYFEQSVIGYKFSQYRFYPYFKSYEESANFLKEVMIEEERTDLFLPMCYLFRNAIELGLKRILLEDTDISYDTAFEIMRRKKHSVIAIWNKIKHEIAEHSNAPEYDTTMKDAEKYISQLHGFDQNSDKFRYPVNKDLKFHFPKESKFSIENVANCFNELCIFLDCVDAMLSEIKSWKSEMRAEYEAEMKNYIDCY